MASLDPDQLQQLPVEIIPNIVMQLGWEPGDIGSLLRSSKVDASSHPSPASITHLANLFVIDNKIRSD